MLTLLVVDDDEAIRSLLVDVLTDNGSRVVSAPHGQAALSMLAHTVPSLIVTDFMMPVMDGLTLLQHLRHHAVTATCPVILLSAVSLPADAVVDAVLRKPFELQVLLTLVARLCGSV